MARSSNRREVKGGDLVRLRSGGRIMTAERVFDGLERPFARCIWFDARETIHRAFFNLPALALVNREGSVSRES